MSGHHLRLASASPSPSQSQSQSPISDLRAPDGGSAALVDGAIEVRDGAGRLMLRYRDGALELTAESGDLRLSAPGGRVQIDAADIGLTATRSLELRGKETRTVTGTATLVATTVRTTAVAIETHARTIEDVAERVTLRTKELTHHVVGLFDSKVGRVRSLVRGAFSLRSKTVHVKAEGDASVDGRRVLLG